MIHKVNILGVDYMVKEVSVVSKDEPRFGQIDFMKCEITIDESLPEDLKQQTLWHEIIHGICELTGNYDISANENAVQSLATAINCVLKTNKII
ncbi:MAG: hypothetical protein LKF83_00115 [Solobacterium sp.]|jgi:hypothetical protein|nr:hypothetical protein [Solobacterium sp.]